MEAKKPRSARKKLSVSFAKHQDAQMEDEMTSHAQKPRDGTLIKSNPHSSSM